jgi:hypothetical protein
MSQTVSRRPPTVEAWVSVRVSPCGICGVQSGTWTGFSPSSSVFPCQYHATRAPYSYIIWGKNNRSVCGRSSETYSHPIDIKKRSRPTSQTARSLNSTTEVCSLKLMTLIIHIYRLVAGHILYGGNAFTPKDCVMPGFTRHQERQMAFSRKFVFMLRRTYTEFKPKSPWPGMLNSIQYSSRPASRPLLLPCFLPSRQHPVSS